MTAIMFPEFFAACSGNLTSMERDPRQANSPPRDTDESINSVTLCPLLQRSLISNPRRLTLWSNKYDHLTIGL